MPRFACLFVHHCVRPKKSSFGFTILLCYTDYSFNVNNEIIPIETLFSLKDSAASMQNVWQKFNRNCAKRNESREALLSKQNAPALQRRIGHALFSKHTSRTKSACTINYAISMFDAF